MRALVFDGPRSVRVAHDVPIPAIADGEALVRVTHAGLCGSNTHPYLGLGAWARSAWPSPPGWLGHENVGEVVETRCPTWPVGTMVNAQGRRHGGFAEYMPTAPPALARLPEGAADPGAFVIAQPLATVLRALARTEGVAGLRCAVVGQGPIGLLWTYLLRRAGARQVIGIDLAPWRLGWASRYGATDTVDASAADDVPGAVRDLTQGAMVDLSIDAGSTPEATASAAFLPRYGGRFYAFAMPQGDDVPFPWLHTVNNETRVLTCHGPGLLDYLQPAVDLVAGDCRELQALCTPRLPLARAAEAFEMYVRPAAHPGSLKILLEM